MGIFDWFKGKKASSDVPYEVALAQGNARVKRLSEAAIITFIYYNEREEFYLNDPFASLSAEKYLKVIERLKILAEYELKKSTLDFDKDIEMGLQAIYWMHANVQDKTNKRIFEGVIRGVINYDSTINQHMICRVALLVASNIIDEGNNIKNQINTSLSKEKIIQISLEKLAQNILIREDIARKIEHGENLLV